MSFDIALLKYKNGVPATIDREQVRAVLRQHQAASNRFQEGSYEVQFADGSYVEIAAPGLDDTGKFDGFGAGFRSLTDSVVTFLFDFARAGDLVIGVEADEEVYIVVDADHRQHLPNELKAFVTVCDSPQRLAEALSGGYGEWSDYRNRMLRPGSDNDRTSEPS